MRRLLPGISVKEQAHLCGQRIFHTGRTADRPAAAERKNLRRVGVLRRKEHSAHHFQYRGDHEAGGSCRELPAEAG